MIKTLLGAAAIAALGATLSYAQTPPAPPPAAAPMASTPAKPMAAKPTRAERQAKSKECSAQADAQKLHGKARKKFRSECMGRA